MTSYEAATMLETRKSAYGDSQRYMALALSNRGVLHVVQGDVELARQDFTVATELKSGIAALAKNLARLDNAYVAEAN
jgi:hypothetical protein